MQCFKRFAFALSGAVILCNGTASARQEILRAVAPGYAETVAIAPETIDVLGKWRGKICPRVEGLTEDQSRHVAEQIARRAKEVGLKVRDEGCTANINVFFVEDGTRLAVAMNKQDPSMFQYFPEAYVTTLGRTRLNEFMNDYRPVRWWHIGTVTDRAGRTLAGLSARNGMTVSNPQQRIVDSPSEASFMGLATNRQAEATRLDNSTRNSFSQVFIIADTLRLDDQPLAEVADYIAFVSLAQINPDAVSVDAPSILNLFDRSAPDVNRSTSLSLLDKAYLESLYNIDTRITGSKQQTRRIADRMAKQLPE